MIITNLTSRTQTDPDPEGWMDMSPDERKKWIREHNPEEVAREEEQRKAMEEARQRIKEREANLSPEAKECWDAMNRHGYEDPVHDLRESIRQGIITRYNLREEIKALEKTNPGERTRLMREKRERNADDSEWYSPVKRLYDLKEDLAECEMMLKLTRDQLKELIAQRDVSLLLQEQKQIAYCLRLLFKFTADESVRQDIEEKTRARAAEWEKLKKSEWVVRKNGIVKINEDGSYQRGKTLSPKSYSQLADGIRRTLTLYSQMLTDYAGREAKNTSALATEEENERLKQTMKAMNAAGEVAIRNAEEEWYARGRVDGITEQKAKVDKARNRTTKR